MKLEVFVGTLKTIQKQKKCDYVLNTVRKLDDRDLRLFMKYLYQEGFQDCADLERMDSDKAIEKLIDSFNKV